MKRLILVLAVLSLFSCTRSSRTAVDRWANDMREIDRVEDVDNRFSSYDYFHDLYNQIEAYTLEYNLQTDEAIKSSLRMIVNREIGKYNANSNKYYRAQWKDRGLPDQIDFIK